MVKGASIKLKSYEETIPKLLDLLKLQRELKKYDKIVLKPNLTRREDAPNKEFVESILQFCLKEKNPVADVYIAEGSDGYDTRDIFDILGYNELAEKYSVSLIDLNNTETEEIEDPEFLKFSTIHYPKILLESFVISLPKLSENEETHISSSLSTMLGAFPASHYTGFFSQNKNKIRKWPIKYSIHDIIKCKLPDFAIIDASEHGLIFAGLPLEIDKQSTKLVGLEWKAVPHLKLLDESLSG